MARESTRENLCAAGESYPKYSGGLLVSELSQCFRKDWAEHVRGKTPTPRGARGSMGANVWECARLGHLAQD